MEKQSQKENSNELEKQLDELIKCKSFSEVKKNYPKEKMIKLIKLYMKSDSLDYESELESKLEECSEKSKFN